MQKSDAELVTSLVRRIELMTTAAHAGAWIVDMVGLHAAPERFLFKAGPLFPEESMHNFLVDLKTYTWAIYPVERPVEPDVKTNNEKTPASCRASPKYKRWMADMQREFNEQWYVDEGGNMHQRRKRKVYFDVDDWLGDNFEN